jgi:hypothetical protein
MERKHPAYNNYFLKKQPNLTISLHKNSSIGKEVQSTKHHTQQMSTKNSSKMEPSSKSIDISYMLENQFIFNTINDIEPKTTKHLSKQNRSY